MTAGSSSHPTSTSALAAAGVTVVLWASAFVGIRSVGAWFSPGSLALGRLLVGSVVLSMVVVSRGALSRRVALPRGRVWFLIVGYGLLWFAGYNVALNAAERHLDAGTSALLVNVGPILIAVLAGIFLSEGFPRWLIVGSLIAFGGVAVITLGASTTRAVDPVGVVFCLVAAVLYAGGVVGQKVALRTVPALSATWLGCLVGTVACLPFAGRLLGELGPAPASAILGLVYLGVFPTAVAFTTWAYALSRMDAGKTSATTYLVPAVAIGLSWLLLSETPGIIGLVGGVICLVGVAVTRRTSGGRTPTPTAEEPPTSADGTRLG